MSCGSQSTAATARRKLAPCSVALRLPVYGPAATPSHVATNRSCSTPCVGQLLSTAPRSVPGSTQLTSLMAVRSLLMSGFSGAPIRSQSSTTVAVEPKSLGTVNTPHTDSLTVIPQEESTSQVPTLSQDQVNSAPQEPPQDINKVPPLSREEIRQFNLCIKKATEEKSTGELQSALLYYNKALLIRPGYQKLIHKIRSLELKVQDSKNSKSPENAMPTTEIPPVTIHERDIEESANSNVSDNLQNEHLPHSLETDTVHFGNEHTSNKTVSNVDHPNAQVPLSEEQLLEQLFPEEFQFSINSKPVSYNIQVAEPCPLTTREELQEVPSFSVKPTSELVSGTAAISSDSDEHIPEQNVIEPVPGCSFVHDLSSKTYKLGDVFSVPPRIFEVLFSYQKRGVEWLWSIHNLEPPGGCLGDDMGLGKTLQLIAFLSGLFLNKLIKQALIVCPLSVINHWVSELHKWAPQISVGIFHGSNPAQRLKEFKRVQKMTGICLTTYGMLLTQQEELCSVTWDYVILDEGHKIKNSKTQISKVARQIPSTRRILVSGTPIMNNLQELWSLMDWVCQGKLLGTLKEFRRTYEDPIVQGNDKHATELAKGVGSKLAESLRKLIHPYVLRREKKDVLQAPPSPYHLPEPPSSSEKMIEKATSSPSKSSLNQSGKVTVSPGTTKLRRRSVILTARKNDFIIWVKMSDQQVRLYKEFLGTDEITAVLSRSRSPLAALTVLKKICDSPNLLHEEMVTTSTLDLKSFKKCSPIETSAKMRCLFALLENQVPLGHRFLIFSQSVRMLDIIEKELIAKDYKLCRIDGRMTSTSERQAVINEFNSDTEINCFLLTTQVGGLGINLTSADRVCIVDPSWSTIDNQAVDRVYRIGQTKDVVIYRFMTCGSIEEKIYRKQVFKESLLRMTFQDKNQYRYFSAQELRELFTFDDPTFSTTQQQLAALHSNRVSYPELDEHLAFLQSLPVVAGLSDHDLLFTKEAIDNPNCAEEEINSLISEAEQTLKVKSSPSRGKLITSTTNKKKDSVNRKLSFSSDEELAVSTPTVAQHNHSVIIISSDEDAEASATPVPGTVAEVPVDLTEPDNEAPTPTPVDLTEPDDEAPLPPSLPDEVEQGTTTSPSSEKAQPVAPDTEPRVTPTPPPSHVCETHLRECYPIAPQHCRCFLSPENLEAYNSFMAKSSIERGGKDELKWLLAALELCDDDLQLHKRAAYLGFLLGF